MHDFWAFVIPNPVNDGRVFITARVGVRDLELRWDRKHKVPRTYSHNEESLCSLTALGMTVSAGVSGIATEKHLSNTLYYGEAKFLIAERH